MNTWGNCRELFWISNNVLVFLDTTTDYIWIYNIKTNNPIYIFTFYKTIKSFFERRF